MMKTLKDLFCDELGVIYDAEQRIAVALPKMIKAAVYPELQAALEFHLQLTEGHVARLEEVFKSVGKKVNVRKCDPAMSLLQEGDEIVAGFAGSPAINVALISVVQKVEHHQIASYGCLREWAGLLEYGDAAVVFDEILDQTRAVDGALTELARSGVNEESDEFFDVPQMPGRLQTIGGSNP